MAEINQINRRRYYRIECARPICSEITIVKVNNIPVNTGKTKVCIEDISIGGLKFVSKLILPVDPNIIVNFSLVVSDQEIILQGFIVRSSELTTGIFQYGVKFLLQESEIKSVGKILNDLEYLKNRKVTDFGPSFCIKDKLQCFSLEKTEKERRGYFRFECPSPLCAKLAVSKINNKVIDSLGDTVCIEDISQSGFRFLSHINYPVINDIYYELQMIVSDLKLNITAHLVRKREIEHGIFEYGAKIDASYAQREDLKRFIEAVRKDYNRKLWFKKSSFCKKDKMDCLRSRI